MVLSPKNIYKDFRNGDIDKYSAIEILISLIENIDNSDIRLECIDILQKIDFRNEKIFSLLENLMLSDSNEKVRISAANTLKEIFNEKALPPLRWALENEKSLHCLSKIISVIGEIKNPSARLILIEKINEINSKKYKYNLKILFEKDQIKEFTNKELAELLINYFIISSLKIRFGYLKFDYNKDGAVINLDLSNVENQSFKKLTNYLESILSLSFLKYLDLSNNNLIDIPIKSDITTSLEYLDLSYNKLSKIPESINSYTSLKILNLKFNKLKALPVSIGSLSNLENLNLRSNQIKSLPSNFGLLTTLKIFDIQGNSLKQLPKSFSNLKNLRELQLGGNNFIEIPESIKDLSSLTQLGLGRNKISSLPNWLDSLSSLRQLDLPDNQIKEISSLDSLPKSLEILNLRNNSLTSLSRSLNHLKKLKILNLSWNNLKELPDWITSLSSLEELNLWANHLESIPNSIESLKSLKILYLNFTNIKELPEILKTMKEKGLTIKI